MTGLEKCPNRGKAKLEKCPFCGGEAEVQHQSRELYGDIVSWYGVYCKKQFCGYVSGQSTEAEAIAAWNTRVNGSETEETSDNAPLRTCENDSDSGFLCSACGFGDFDGFHGYKPHFCPNCGAKVVES